MKKSKEVLAVAVWFLCLAASAGATPSWSLTASVAEATGPSALDADLLFLGQQGHVASGFTPSAAFHLIAERLHVETDHDNLSVAAADVRGNILPTTTPHDYVHAAVQGVDVRETSYRFFVFPLPNEEPPAIHATASQCMRFEPSDSERIERGPKVRYSREALAIDASSSLRWTDCTTASPTIRGDFVLVLWEWDAELRSGGETVDLPSGHQGAAGMDQAGGILGPATEQYLFAYNAVLTIPSLAGSPRVHVHDASVATSQVKLVDAAGHITHADEVLDATGSEVLVQGQISARLQGLGVDQHLEARVGGEVDEVRVDGQHLSVGTPIGGGSWPWLWVLLLPVLGIVGGGTALLARRRVGRGRARRVEHLESRIQELFPRQEYGAALRYAQRLLRLEPDHPEGRVMQALCLGNLERHGEAHEAHKKTHWRLQLSEDGEAEHWIAENAYQAARVCIELRRQATDESQRDEYHQMALQWLQTAFMLDAKHYVVEARMEPDFGPILRDVTVLAEQLGGRASEWMQP